MLVRNAGIVSFSSRLVAGMRAMESQEDEPLFKDPLAEVLAGKRGMSAARATLQVGYLSAYRHLCRQ